MREVIFRNLTSVNSRKKDIFLKEVFEKDGVLAKTERRCFYFIKNMTPLDGDGDLQRWVDAQNQVKSLNRRNFHILKAHNDRLGEDRLMCKIAGTFYAVADKMVYTIAFLHSFKVNFVKDAFAK